MKRGKWVFRGILVLILIGIAGGYYVIHREDKKVDSIDDKRSGDSTRSDVNEAPFEMGAEPNKDAKDGSVEIVKEFIKGNSKNPGTFQFLEWSEISSEGGYWKVRCKYTGISSFKAEVTTNAWFYIRNDKVVYTKIISKI